MEQRYYFQIRDEELAYLSKRDKRMAEAIGRIGPVRREMTPDLFTALVFSIVGQQISTKAQITICNRMRQHFGEITPEILGAASPEEIQQSGISMRKASYIRGIADNCLSGDLDLEALHSLPDGEVCARLCALKGIGIWTAEMLMLFSMGRRDIFSFDDLAILRGLRMLYRHREITRERFERYRKRYSPCGSAASLYLWEIASGRHGYSDPAVRL